VAAASAGESGVTECSALLHVASVLFAVLLTMQVVQVQATQIAN
jgi:hypothetical protein